MLVEGAILDIDGSRPGYVRLRRGRVVETGQLGTDSSHGRDRRLRGIVVPRPVNGHTHLADSVATREPPPGPLSDLVRPPDGFKFRLLAEATAAQKLGAMRTALRSMARQGVGAVLDFREEGVPGALLLRAAARGVGIRAVVLARPLRRPLDPTEMRELLAVSDGIGLSSAREESRDIRSALQRACRRAHRKFALHASEEVRETPAAYLDPVPDLLIHLACATPADLREVKEAGVAAAVCPRSNALFGRQPDLATMERLDLPLLIGTDNGMLRSPTLWRELEFAYVSSRLRRRPVSAEYIARAAFVEPWRWLGEPGRARIARGSSAEPLVVRLPPDDPAYQVVTRATEHLIVDPGSADQRGRGR